MRMGDTGMQLDASQNTRECKTLDHQLIGCVTEALQRLHNVFHGGAILTIVHGGPPFTP